MSTERSTMAKVIFSSRLLLAALDERFSSELSFQLAETLREIARNRQRFDNYAMAIEN